MKEEAMTEERTQFDYLLNAFERASQSDRPAEHGYRNARKALYAYVRDLENRASPQPAPAVQPEPAIGDYVLATKYADGDPGDMWALGFYDGVRDTQGRHYAKDDAGKQIRGNGFRRVARIRTDVGRWLLTVAAPHLERCPPGTVNLWTMLTPAAFNLAEQDGKDTPHEP